MVKHDSGHNPTYERVDDIAKLRQLAERHASLARSAQGEKRAAYFKSAEALKEVARLEEEEK